MRSTPQGDACQGGGVPTTSPVVAGGSLRGSCGTPPGQLWDASGAWHTLARAAERAVLGDTKPDDGGITQQNLHSVRVGKTCAGHLGGRSVQQGVEADTWPPEVEGEGATRWRPGAA